MGKERRTRNLILFVARIITTILICFCFSHNSKNSFLLFPISSLLALEFSVSVSFSSFLYVLVSFFLSPFSRTIIRILALFLSRIIRRIPILITFLRILSPFVTRIIIMILIGFVSRIVVRILIRFVSRILVRILILYVSRVWLRIVILTAELQRCYSGATVALFSTSLSFPLLLKPKKKSKNPPLSWSTI